MSPIPMIPTTASPILAESTRLQHARVVGGHSGCGTLWSIWYMGQMPPQRTGAVCSCRGRWRMLRTRNLDRESRRNISFARVSFSALARASPDGLHPTQNSIATEDLISTHALKTRTNTTTPSKHASQEEGRARCDGECSARSSGPRRCARLNAIPHRRPGTRLTMPSPTQASLSSASHASSPLSMTPSSTLPISRTSEQHTLLHPNQPTPPPPRPPSEKMLDCGRSRAVGQGHAYTWL